MGPSPTSAVVDPLLIIVAVLGAWGAVRLLRWARGETPHAAASAVQLDDGGRFAMDVVGEAAYQSNLEQVSGGRHPDGVSVHTVATIIPETSNPHDPHACRIEIAGLPVGYLYRGDAFAYRRELAKYGTPLQIVQVPALITGGWDRGAGDLGHFGVRLDLPDPH